MLCSVQREDEEKATWQDCADEDALSRKRACVCARDMILGTRAGRMEGGVMERHIMET